ncbi:hypothetical protein B0H13DRAFT_1885190 [Mycena leptocephala]|nr:hypothetical protein B0H13DRAFT_1885190 [Mycena leptocephala]
MQYRQFKVGKRESCGMEFWVAYAALRLRVVFDTVQPVDSGKHGILDGICRLEPQSCVQCANQPPFKFATKRRYSHFEVGKRESRQVGNLKQFSRLQCGILCGMCSLEPQSCVCRKAGKQASRQVGNLKQFGRLQHGILGGMCSLEPESYVCTVSSKGESRQCVNQPPFKFPTKMQYSQFEVGKQESRQLGNLKEFSRLWRGILGGICSPEPQSCVQCVNQPPLKFPAKMRYSQFKVGRWESGHLGIRTRDIGNLKQLSRLQCGILDGICSLDPHSCVQCANQPLFKFPAQMQYSQFKVESRHVGNLTRFEAGKQDSGQLGNSKQFGRLWRGILSGMCSPEPQSQFTVGRWESGHLGNLKQFSWLQHVILCGMCSLEPQSCVCQKAQKQARRQVRNLKQFGRLQHGILGGMCSLEPESYVQYTKSLFKFATKMWYSQFKVGKWERGQLGNSKQFGRLWCGILGGICSLEPQSWVRQTDFAAPTGTK